MPQLGETVTEGTITKWFKAVGEQVARDEPLFEVSTDKVDSEVPSPAEGVLSAILVAEGDTVDVGVKLAEITDGPASNGHVPESDGATAVKQEVPAPAPPPTAPSSAPLVVAAPPSQPAGDFSPAPDPASGSPVTSASPVTALSGEGLVLSPVVRKLLHENGIDPTAVQGTGLGGRITRGDVESVIGSHPRVDSGESSHQPAPVPSIAGRTAVSSPAEPGRTDGAVAPVDRSPDGSRDEVVPFTNIRRRTAEHMVRSKATSAHTLMVKEVDYERVEQVRRAHGGQFKSVEGFSLSYLPFAARAAVEALVEFPHLNSSVGEDALIVHHDINLGIAVDLENEGLIVPVVHNAEELNLLGMARRIRDLADRARNKRLSLDDISGGTFSITNAGPFGTLLTGAIINQPQVAILSTDGVARKPVVVELPDGSESIAIHSVGLAAMTFDHRAVDGAYVARFLARLSEILNDRDWAGEL
jgi:2-oxoglutarate dehydrogenase E2 component (dihydrolipoamide succinyltransferase)